MGAPKVRLLKRDRSRALAARPPSLPALLPDETLSGYSVRLALQNGLPNVRSVYTRFFGLTLNSPGLTTPQKIFLAIILSDWHEVNFATLLRNHTSLPFWEPFLIHSGNGAIRQVILRKLSRIKGHRDQQFCPDCAIHDIREHGHTYWHRSHQLPGVAVCYRHGKRLISQNSPNIRLGRTFGPDLSPSVATTEGNDEDGYASSTDCRRTTDGRTIPVRDYPRSKKKGVSGLCNHEPMRYAQTARELLSMELPILGRAQVADVLRQSLSNERAAHRTSRSYGLQSFAARLGDSALASVASWIHPHSDTLTRMDSRLLDAIFEPSKKVFLYDQEDWLRANLGLIRCIYGSIEQFMSAFRQQGKRGNSIVPKMLSLL